VPASDLPRAGRPKPFEALVLVRPDRLPLGKGLRVRLRGMGTGISEASKRVPIFSFATQGGKRVPIFDRGTGSKSERLRSGFLQADLSLIV
jgi:hypothetical protein